MPILCDRECSRCNGSGEIVARCTFPMSEVGPGPVSDLASGFTGSKCPGCDGSGVIEVDIEEECE